MLNVIFMLALLFCSLVLILLILVQRGKGGGLAGALGGMGGQSAFGAKAGDTFTRITIVVAVIWIFLCLGAVAFLKPPKSRLETATENSRPGAAVPASAEKTTPVTKDTGSEKAGEEKAATEKPAEKAEEKPAK